MSAHGGRPCYRPHGIPVPATAWERAQGVSPVTARGELLDQEGHYMRPDQGQEEGP